MDHHAITRDHALLHLLDRCGQDVEVTVEVEKGDTTAAPVSARGVLRQWRDEPRLRERWAGIPRDDIDGLYDVGGASFDVTVFEGARLLADDDEPPYGLTFELADGVTLVVVWGEEEGTG